ncbi:gamma-glutamylcysteine synthetase, putative [Plasmodium vivax]|uniref:Gamma-glutamylcysteine synthetase, putative n=1 Tax=Plasmodium vivax TaxID=5855 RepID=A0A565A6I9_PLAVI|nr:gamma-glutamylcysteine synthetase, putative [Plasmodium vivax]
MFFGILFPDHLGFLSVSFEIFSSRVISTFWRTTKRRCCPPTSILRTSKAPTGTACGLSRHPSWATTATGPVPSGGE